MSACLSVCLLTGLLNTHAKTTDQILIKFYGIVGHNPGTDQLDLGGNPDLDPNPGIS